MRADIRHSEVLRFLFGLLEGHGVAYCVLRGWGSAPPDATGFELDVLADAEDFKRFLHFVERAGFAAMPAPGHAPHAFFVGYDQHLGTWIKLDVVTDLLYGRPIRALSFGKPDAVLERRIWRDDVPVLAPADEFLHLLLHGLLDKPALSPSCCDRLRELYERFRLHERELALLARDFEVALGPSLPWTTLADACERDVWTGVVARSRAVIRHAIRRQPAAVTRRIVATGTARFFSRPRGPRLRRGCLVALLGPDGAGKTTVAEGIAATAPFKVRRVYMGHGAGEVQRQAGILKLLARLAREVRPGQPRRRSLMRSGTRWLARLILQSIRSAEIRFRRAVGHLVVLDRHVFDHAVNQAGKSAARRWIGRVIQRICPPPDLVIVLDAPAEVLHRRRAAEHAADELAAQRLAYVEFCGQVPGGIIVDSARSATEVRNDVVARIWARYTQPWREAVQ